MAKRVEGMDRQRPNCRIVLYREQGIWIAVMSKASDALHVQELFGTCHIPTPYLSTTPGTTVQAKVASLNPGQAVTVAEGSE